MSAPRAKHVEPEHASIATQKPAPSSMPPSVLAFEVAILYKYINSFRIIITLFSRGFCSKLVVVKKVGMTMIIMSSSN